MIMIVIAPSPVPDSIKGTIALALANGDEDYLDH